jgi:hypothetical protein
MLRRAEAGEPAISLMEYAIRRVGVRKGAQVVAFMLAWEGTRRELGRDPTLDEYRESWKVSRATAFREQARFRECFPQEENPSRLLDALLSVREERRTVKALGAARLAL